ncbi:glycosyltransferase family 4 protein [Xylella taiwanensis]|uniref:Glycosyl transferase family 1 n=1 Tax=Xylella taiwanensis TaxID=1444770 RepID=Z9JLW6_9GAMM|nr:glycosyltransferase family 4 protein [Xylella taiwanensis]EWS79405.1 glycosyl transferase family 1 [Xylella taiwanensis]MCD8455330.1 glycosyltransferase family 4 protein [Xylella taiwanensis]MCD8457735.1 glycosyltransferase family 4 protein [Xylella taiwanensis]MCD8459871.1 glycosyltransferase family 4 protein [Xylella taiwanensis]MCD8464068.1 glycosyltransferase family 4 protein [Xylella taiwanensis]
MKLLFVGTSRGGGGAESHFVGLARAMAETNHEIAALVHPDGLIARQLEHSPIRLFPAKFRNVMDWRGYVAIERALRVIHPDVLVGDFGKEYWPLLLMGRLYRLPVVLFRHRLPPMNRFSTYWVPRLADRFFAVSDYAHRHYLAEGMPPERVQVLYNPVDTDAFRPDPTLRRRMLHELGWDEEAIVVGCFGRIHEGKGVFVLAEAMELAMQEEPCLRCLWLGTGVHALRLAATVAGSRFASQQRMLDWVTDPAGYFQALAMLAMPSLSPETFGRVSVEAQASGVPVLVSDVGGASETLQDGTTGMLLPAGDVHAWRHAILACCDPQRRAAMAAAAPGFVQARFSKRVIAAQFARELERVISERNQPIAPLT